MLSCMIQLQLLNNVAISERVLGLSSLLTAFKVTHKNLNRRRWIEVETKL